MALFSKLVGSAILVTSNVYAFDSVIQNKLAQKPTISLAQKFADVSYTLQKDEFGDINSGWTSDTIAKQAMDYS